MRSRSASMLFSIVTGASSSLFAATKDCEAVSSFHQIAAARPGQVLRCSLTHLMKSGEPYTHD